MIPTEVDGTTLPHRVHRSLHSRLLFRRKTRKNLVCVWRSVVHRLKIANSVRSHLIEKARGKFDASAANTRTHREQHKIHFENGESHIFGRIHTAIVVIESPSCTYALMKPSIRLCALEVVRFFARAKLHPLQICQKRTHAAIE